MDPKDRPLAELIGHPIEISTACRCTKVAVFGLEYLLERIGSSATLRIAEARMRCRVCRARPSLSIGLAWAVSDGRDMRVNPAPLPEWARDLVR